LAFTRRHFAGAAAATVVAAGAGAWWLKRDGEAAAPKIDPADLATASPLGDMALGAANAPVTIIEYASMTCSHCAAFHRTVFPELKAQYIDTGTVRFVFREFPIDPVAATGSMLARCLAKDDPKKYHAAIDGLFATQDKWMDSNGADQLRGIARQAGLSDDSFNACITDQKLLTGLQQGRDHAHKKLKVDATPTFFVNGRRMVGTRPFDEFVAMIEMNLRA
jgi:protein-disulfide isomerase